MVLDSLSSALRATMRKIAGASHISPELIKELVRDIQRALLQADVNVKLALDLSKRIESRALEEKAPGGMTAREHVVRIVHQEMVGALGTARDLKPSAQKIMLVGLYGQGKTTTAGKLAKWFQHKGLSVGLTGADVHRPAAYEQLSQLAEQLNGPISKPVDFAYIWGDALRELKRAGPDVRIINLETSVTVSEDIHVARSF